MVIARKIAYNVVSSAAAKFVSTALALVAIGFITRYLGREGFGNYATVLAFFSFFAAISDLGFYAVTAREISRLDADEEKIISNVIPFRIITSAAVFLLSLAVVFFLPYPPEVKKGILLASAALIFSSGYMVLNGVFQKNLAMDKVAAVELAGKFIQTGIIILAVKKDLGFTILITSLLAYMVFNFVVVYWMSRKYIKYRLEFDFAYWKKFLHMSLPMGMSVIITFLYFKLDTILLSILRTSADVGIYNAAYKVIENITFFPAMMIGLILPLMSRDIFAHREKFEDVSNKIFKVFFLLVTPLLVGILFLADGVVSAIGGVEFAASAGTLRILVFALIFIFFGNFFNSILLAGNLQKKLMHTLSFCAAFNIISNLIIIPLYSYNGAAFTSALTEMLVVGLTARLVWKNLQYKPKIEHGARILFSGAVMALFLYIFQERNFIFLGLVSSAVYFAMLWLTRAVRSEEILTIISRKNSEQV